MGRLSSAIGQRAPRPAPVRECEPGKREEPASFPFAVAAPTDSPGPQPRRGIIVHADDFGLSENVNEGILLAHTQGIVTSASLMAVGGAFEHAVELSRRTPTLDIGVHLTLTEEQPLLSPAVIASLVDGQGRFHRHAVDLTKRYLFGKIRLEEVRQELGAQLKKARETGLRLSHVDSHQHVHMLPGIFSVVSDLAKEHGIPVVRIPREKLSWGVLRRSGSTIRVLQLLALNALCGKASAAVDPARRAEHFAGFLFGGNLDAHRLRFLLTHLPATGRCEVMCHPGKDDPRSPYRHWNYQWSTELDALTAPECRSLLRQRQIPLLSFRDLR